MLRKFGAAALLMFAAAMPVQDRAAAQDALGGALLGGAAGAIIGGAATGKGSGAAVGAVIGATAGALIASQGQRRGDYYYWRTGCYVQRRDGSWIRVSQRYCDRPVVVVPRASSDAIAYCAQRYRSYDPVSMTYIGYDGRRHRCP